MSCVALEADDGGTADNVLHTAITARMRKIAHEGLDRWLDICSREAPGFVMAGNQPTLARLHFTCDLSDERDITLSYQNFFASEIP